MLKTECIYSKEKFEYLKYTEEKLLIEADLSAYNPC